MGTRLISFWPPPPPPAKTWDCKPLLRSSRCWYRPNPTNPGTDHIKYHTWERKVDDSSRVFMYWWNELMCGQMKMSRPLTKFSTFFYVVLAVAKSLAVFQRPPWQQQPYFLHGHGCLLAVKALDIHIMWFYLLHKSSYRGHESMTGVTRPSPFLCVILEAICTGSGPRLWHRLAPEFITINS